MTDAPMIPDLIPWRPVADILPFPDRSAILIDRAADGSFTVEPYGCPIVGGRGQAFNTAGDALDHAEALAAEADTSVFLMCDVD